MVVMCTGATGDAGSGGMESSPMSQGNGEPGDWEAEHVHVVATAVAGVAVAGDWG
jgi:hypothetical protein